MTRMNRPESEAASRTSSGAGNKVAKTQIVDRVAEQTSLNRKQAGEAVSAMLDCMISALREGRRVGLPGLGTLSVTQTAARTGVRPGTSQRIQIPAGKKVAFKIASTLKQQL